MMYCSDLKVVPFLGKMYKSVKTVKKMSTGQTGHM